ncbi:IclR family transcriptional regulator [Propionivibrio sp.]|uniref:IclR family transcriptional regulator n=1 Tax=Propionivibrio sp. TaxID=2212460 RepID=UPI0039E4D3CC
MSVDPKKDKNPGDSATGSQTLLRGLALLECVAAGISDVKSIAAHLGTPRSTTHRMLGALVQQRYLHHIPYKGYLLGQKLIELGNKALEQRPLVALARPHLEQLASHTGDTVHLGVMEGTEVFYLDKISGTRGSLEMRSRVGNRMPLATTGVGKALVLGLPRAQWRAIYDYATGERRAQGAPAVIEWTEYALQMDEYLRQGWVMDLEENEMGIRCVGAPIRDLTGKVVASVSLASAVPYMPEERMRRLGPLVRDTAEAISKELGWTPE